MIISECKGYYWPNLPFVDMARPFTQSTNSTHEELDLALLLNTLSPVASKCHILGLQLGVTYPQLRNIEHDYKKCQEQLCEILTERLKQDSPLTWHDIVTALRAGSVREYSLDRSQVHTLPASSSLSTPSS